MPCTWSSARRRAPHSQLAPAPPRGTAGTALRQRRPVHWGRSSRAPLPPTALTPAPPGLHRQRTAPCGGRHLCDLWPQLCGLRSMAHRVGSCCKGAMHVFRGTSCGTADGKCGLQIATCFSSQREVIRRDPSPAAPRTALQAAPATAAQMRRAAVRAMLHAALPHPPRPPPEPLQSAHPQTAW